MGKTRDTGFLGNCVFTDSSNNVGIGAAANASFKLQVTGATNLTGALSGTSATFSGAVQGDFLVVGTTAATSGGLRLGTQVAIRARNVANTANIPLIESTASDGVSVSNGALILASTGAATFNASASAPQFYITRSEQTNQGFSIQAGGGETTFNSYEGTNSVYGSYIFNSTRGSTTYTAMSLTKSTNTTLTLGTTGEVPTIKAGGTNTDLSIQSVGSGGFIEFVTNASPRMYITSGGRIDLGTTAISGEVVKVTGTSGLDNYISVYSGSIHMFVDADASNSSGITGTQSNHNLKLRTGGINRMNIDTSGNIGAPNSGSNIYSASDLRLKQNIETIENGLDKIIALNPVKFNWIDGFVETEDGKDMLGFIAQEVQNAIPEAVEDFSSNSITIGEKTIENPLRVNEKFIIPVLVKAIQELTQKVNALENK
jgi:hypothetical protein